MQGDKQVPIFLNYFKTVFIMIPYYNLQELKKIAKTSSKLFTMTSFGYSKKRLSNENIVDSF